MKLQHLSETNLDQLFSNIATYLWTASLTDKVNTVVKQAIEATKDCQTC
jgi:hypothetical protein